MTNFDITRYDVEKIAASSTLLPSDAARRKNKLLLEAPPQAVVDISNDKNTSRGGGEGGGEEQVQENTNGNSDWKMLLCTQSPPPMQQSVGYPSGLNGLMSVDMLNSPQVVVDDDSGKIGNTQHMSNASSLVTSLSSSREDSPDRTSLSMLLSKSSALPISTWIPSTTQMKPAISLAQMAVFAGWTDT